MANILVGDVERYVKILIAEEFGKNTNGNNHQKNRISIDTEHESRQASVDTRCEPEKKEV